MKMKMMLVLALMVVVASASYAVNANGDATIVNFWMTASGSTTPITFAKTTPGVAVTLDIWYSADGLHAGVGTFFAWDRSNTAASTSTATLQDKNLTGAGTWSSADFQTSPSATSVSAKGTVPVPFGRYMAANAATGVFIGATAGTKLGSVTLTPSATFTSGTYDAFLFTPTTLSAPYYGCWVSSLAGGTSGKVYPVWTSNKSIVTISVPEPSSILALASGMIGIAGFAIRRRA